MKDTASFEKFLNPERLRETLISAAVFLVAYEMLKDALVGHLRSFFADAWTVENGWETSSEYRKEVLSLDRKEMVACAKWFKQNGALDDDDLTLLKEIADHRNTVAHELPSIIGSIEKSVPLLHLRCICALATKIDNWWLREIEFPTNPTCDGLSDEQVDESCSLRMAWMAMLIQLVEGDDSALVELYRRWKHRNQQASSP